MAARSIITARQGRLFINGREIANKREAFVAILHAAPPIALALADDTLIAELPSDVSLAEAAEAVQEGGIFDGWQPESREDVMLYFSLLGGVRQDIIGVG